ncbi:nucleolar protein 8 [Pleurodeles waltl]|uniref:nucleolar protein 8 n=1 Tax=Pleurodeles waltl TaxID=8319 RepID=UPI0037095D2D
MEKNKSVKRLYVGGLGHTISQAELEERFSKFGDVTDVEIVARKDEQGNPSKTFAYMNININETDLKKCMSILNKTKWRGGTLQIELAKESFLHRLAQEREEAKEKKDCPQQDRKSNLVQSMKKAGVENFQMRAVPGTEVPNHKDWVVSKFGRVLPVLHLQHRNKAMKYDPSKYCHNIKRLEEDSGELVPVSQLTWHLDEGNDDISRKRRGEFPTPKHQLKKKKGSENVLKNEHSKNLTIQNQDSTSTKRIDVKSNQSLDLSYANIPKVNAQGNRSFDHMKKVTSKTRNSMDSEADSEEEMESLIAKGSLPKGITKMGNEDFNIEVVKEDFELKYASHWTQWDSARAEKSLIRNTPNVRFSDNNSEYDSADTDEIIAVTKPMVRKETKNELTLEPTSYMPGSQESWKSKTSSESSKSDVLSKSNPKSVPSSTDTHSTCPPAESKPFKRHSESRPSSDSSGTGSESADSDETIALTEPLVQNRASCKLLQKVSSVNSCVSESKQGRLKQNTAVCANNNKLLTPSQSDKKYVPKQTDKQTSHSLPRSIQSRSSSESDSLSNSSETEEDPEYEEMMQNCHRINLTLEDLEELANNAQDLSSDENVETPIRSSTEPSLDDCLLHKSLNTEKALDETISSIKIIQPNDIVSSILRDESTDDESKSKSKSMRPKLPTFAGLGSLMTGKMVKEQTSESYLISQPDCSDSKVESSTHLSVSPSSSILPAKQSLRADEGGGPKTKEIGFEVVPKQDKRAGEGHIEIKANVSDSKAETGKLASKLTADRDPLSLKCPAQDRTRQTESEEESEASYSGSSTDEESSSSDTSSSATPKNMNIQKNAYSSVELFVEKKGLSASMEKKTESPHPDLSKQLMDNEKRLAAVQERKKEIDLQKKCIQGALSNLDSQIANKGRHIVFDSNSEDEVEMEEKSVKTEIKKHNTPQTKEATSKKPSKLFESSDEEDVEEDNEKIFSIKSQFEGKAGEKLMYLQSRFGTDERFRMDARFLGSDHEEDNIDENGPDDTAEDVDLATEKKKNMDILQSLLNVNIGSSKSSKQTTKAMLFRDINALHYDPTREDHAVFERKVEPVEKESKAKRKKMREEAEKLPEVSKEIYHEVAMDFKEVFGAAKSAPEEKEEKTPWDQEEEEKVAPQCAAAEKHTRVSLEEGDQDSSAGFTFSFFAAEEETHMKEEPYKIEMIKPAKVAWQEDMRFQDSSEEDDEEKEGQIQITNEEPTVSTSSSLGKAVGRFFFFSQDDERLKEGPTMFWRSSNLDEDLEAWEERRTILLEACRKRHRDARRKVKADP